MANVLVVDDAPGLDTGGRDARRANRLAGLGR